MKKSEIRMFCPKTPYKKALNVLRNGVREYDLEHGMHGFEEFLFCLKQSQHIVGGCSGGVYYQHNLYIDKLWVDKAIRGLGYGTKLMRAVEDHARKKHCYLITVCTMSWHAPDFYKKLGYKIEFKRDGYPRGNCLYFMLKDLRKDP